MGLQKKIFFINMALAIVAIVGFAFATDTFPGNGFFLMISFITFFGGFGSVIVGLLLLFRKDKSAAKGYLATSILLFAISAVSYFFLQQY